MGPAGGSSSQYRPVTLRAVPRSAVLLIDQLKSIFIDAELHRHDNVVLEGRALRLDN